MTENFDCGPHVRERKFLAGRATTGLGETLQFIRKRNVERDLGPFYEYNFCDHPQHEEFISQVRDRWLSVNK